MVANTDQTARVISLSGSAIELVQRGNRSEEQIGELIEALQKFKNGQSIKEKPMQPPPGVFNGNRCTRCGGCIDAGGICHCGFDHDTQTDYRGQA